MISEQELQQLASDYVNEKYANANPVIVELLIEEYKIIFMQGLNYCSDIHTEDGW
jgi:hypothetical protein